LNKDSAKSINPNTKVSTSEPLCRPPASGWYLPWRGRKFTYVNLNSSKEQSILPPLGGNEKGVKREGDGFGQKSLPD
jgi:hypothetical protein